MTRDAVSLLRFFVHSTTYLPERSIARDSHIAKHVLQSCRMDPEKFFPGNFGAVVPQIITGLFETVLLDAPAVYFGGLIHANALLNAVAMELERHTQRPEPLQFSTAFDIVGHAHNVCVTISTACPRTPLPSALPRCVLWHDCLVTRAVRAVECLVVKINERGSAQKAQAADSTRIKARDSTLPRLKRLFVFCWARRELLKKLLGKPHCVRIQHRPVPAHYVRHSFRPQRHAERARVACVEHHTFNRASAFPCRHTIAGTSDHQSHLIGPEHFHLNIVSEGVETQRPTLAGMSSKVSNNHILLSTVTNQVIEAVKRRHRETVQLEVLPPPFQFQILHYCLSLTVHIDRVLHMLCEKGIDASRATRTQGLRGCDMCCSSKRVYC
mmetsp:Transcript_67965/g.110243  ORF Transcript_67965/g.110243 Transcript_67965/m.110243 type:complete len:383 (-) Transcript_67965:218-1366(-)